MMVDLDFLRQQNIRTVSQHLKTNSSIFFLSKYSKTLQEPGYQLRLDWHLHLHIVPQLLFLHFFKT